MSKMSFLDKLNILINLSKTSKFYLIALVVLLIFGIILAFTSKKNEQRNRTLYFIMTVAIATILVVTYHSSLGNMFSYMMNNFFIVVYFPNIAIYLAAIIAMNIIVWISIFSFKSSKLIRLLNITIYIIMNYLLALLLSVVNENKLDIFNQVSIYGNDQATALIELSSIIFVVWIIFLILYKVILIYLKKDYKPKVNKIIVTKKGKELPKNYNPQDNPGVVYGKLPRKTPTTVIVNQKVKELPENFKPQETPEYVYGKAPHKETIIINDEKDLENYDKKFTLEEYKLFSRMLKEYQKRNSTYTLKDIIPSVKKQERLIQAVKPSQELNKEKKLEEEKEQRKLTELEMLYQKVI